MLLYLRLLHVVVFSDFAATLVVELKEKLVLLGSGKRHLN